MLSDERISEIASKAVLDAANDRSDQPKSAYIERAIRQALDEEKNGAPIPMPRDREAEAPMHSTGSRPTQELGRG